MSGFPNGVISERKIRDTAGNFQWTRTRFDEINHLVIEESDFPDVNSRPSASAFSGVDARTFMVNGSLISSQGVDDSEQVVFYDSLGRPFQRWNSAQKYKYTNFLPDSTLPEYVTAYKDTAGSGGNQQVQFDYDIYNRVISRRDLIDHSLPVAEDQYKEIHMAYNAAGKPTHKWGETNPVQYVYDSDYGDLRYQYTYRGGANWTGSLWPSNPGTADVTEYQYDPNARLLNKKISPDGTFVTFSYNLRGQISSVTNARNQTISYEYDTNTGLLVSKDMTPWVTGNDYEFSYNRFGMLTQVKDKTGTRQFKFSVGAAENLAIVEEDLDNTFHSHPTGCS